jgi:hypothetical protein
MTSYAAAVAPRPEGAERSVAAEDSPVLQPVATCDLVLFGGTGDLAMRKLLPALYRRDRDGQLTAGSRSVSGTSGSVVVEPLPREYGHVLVNRSMPRDVLVPVLGYPSVHEAVEWLVAAFGFTRRWQAGDTEPSSALGLTPPSPSPRGTVPPARSPIT